ncbi:hypothetical protein CR513_08853, partial [Mucuna pruriens]
MPSIDPDFLCHCLCTSLGVFPISQKKRRLREEKKRAVKAKIARLLQARFIREIKYSSWLSNVVMVKKPSGKWRMCTNYTNLNKAWSKDPYPLLGCGGRGIKLWPSQLHGCILKLQSDTDERLAVKFLGFMLTRGGIEANPEKCNMVINMRSPKSYVNDSWLVIGKPIYVYISVSDNALSSVIIQEGEGEQRPIYYIYKALQGAKQQYQKIEKVALAIITTARKLRPYFQSPLVVLADFVNELTPNPDDEEPSKNNRAWMLFVDGSSNKKGSGARIILEDQAGFKVSNNQVEYEALLAGIRLVKELGTTPDDPQEARRIKREMARYILVVGQLCKRGEAEADRAIK